MSTEPTAARQFAIDAINAGWNVLIQAGEDTGSNPFVSVECRRGMTPLRLTWHTRETGTYRLFSCVHGHHDISLKVARELLSEVAS